MTRRFGKSFAELREAWRWRDAKHSYSQTGEDLLIDFAAEAMGLPERTYLDIGAHHPVHYSNTYMFYKRGHRGVLIEPDPEFAGEIRRVRPFDTCVEAGVGLQGRASAKFYVMHPRTLSTFSKDEAERYASMPSHRIEREMDIAMVALDDVLEEHFPDASPTFVSIDIEGYDYEILSSLNLSVRRPAIFCVETIQYSVSRDGAKDRRIEELMTRNEYSVFADTYINTIFVDARRWKA